MLVGAAGRDLILSRELSLKASRATYDVDVAIQVRDWSEFESLMGALKKNERAVSHDSIKQRITLPSGTPIDLVPFGEIEIEGEVAWPPDQRPSLDVRGFSEALQLSVAVTLPGGLEVRVPSLETFLCLKLFAWRDRHLRKPRHDSADIREVLKNAEGLIPLETLYDEHEQFMERNDYDSTRACLEVMGHRLGSSLRPGTSQRLLDLLERQLDQEGRLDLIRELGPEPNWPVELLAFRNGVKRGMSR